LHIKSVFGLLGKEKALLFLFDELLDGTNSHDRKIGAENLLRRLVEAGAIGMVTTHDLALTEIGAAIGAVVKNVHFKDQVEQGRMKFDYRLREGVVTKSNAIELMRIVGLEV
jgi:DNA mismatch repair ATPase MutS